MSDDCFQLTENELTQSGSFWSNTPLDLTQEINLAFEINCGNSDWGADGMVFVIQDMGLNALGVGGGSLAVENIIPSLCIEVDVWENPEKFDLLNDHIGILRDGSTNHQSPQSLAGPVQASAMNTNIEDGVDHLLSISWFPDEQVLRVWFDCNLRLELDIDIANEIFGGDTTVYWGMTAATGGVSAAFQACVVENTEQYNTNIDLCLGAATQLDISEPALNQVTWSTDLYLDDETLDNPLSTPDDDVLYTASYTGDCGVRVTETFQLDVTELIVSADSVFDITCGNPEVELNASSTWANTDFTWTTGDGNFVNGENSDSPMVNQAGTYTVEASGLNGQCSSSAEVLVNMDIPELFVDAGDDFTVDCNTQASFLASIQGGEAPYVVSWENQDGDVLGNNNDLDILALSDSTLTFIVTDECLQTVSDDVLVTVDIIPVDIILPDVLIGDCLTIFELEVESDYPQDLDINWSDSNVQLESDFEYSYQSFSSVVLTVEAEGSCGAVDTEEVVITIQNEPLLLAMPNDTAICLGQSININPEISGGVGQLNYSWTGVDSFSASASESPESPSYYNLQVTDQCNQQVEGDLFADVQNIETEIVSIDLGAGQYDLSFIVEPVCPDCINLWEYTPGGSTEDPNPVINLTGIGSMDVSLTLTNPIGCIAEADITLLAPPIIYVPNAFTPDNDGINETFFVEATSLDMYELYIFNRWGEVVFQSTNPEDHWTGDVQGGDYYAPNGVYTWIINYSGFNLETEHISGTVIVIR